MSALIAPMTDDELDLLNEVISHKLGLCFPEHKKAILESRLKPRLSQLNLRRFLDYYFYLQINRNQEFDHLAQIISNNETYFFRETYQFEILFSHAIEELKKDSVAPGKLRFLSAGCSSGEEPYTLNIYTKENQYRLWGHNVEIDAFDVDKKCLQKAEKAHYGNNSLRCMNNEQIEKYMKKINDTTFQLKSIFQTSVKFSYGNILDICSFKKPLAYDVIFCRNVIIYFSESSLHQTIKNLTSCLRRDGLLFLGHSESIIGLTNDYEIIRLGNYIAYRRI